MYMKNLFQDAFNESLDKEGAGVMHFKDQKAKEAGKKEFKLGDKTFPVKEKKKLEDEGAGVMHYKDMKAKEAGKKTFELGGKTFPVKEEKHMTAAQKAERNKIYKGLPKKDIEKRYGKDIRGNIATAKALAENAYGAALGMEAKPAPTPAPTPAPEPDGDAAWKKTLDKDTDHSKFDSESNPSLKLDTEGVEKARQWIKKLDDMATFINGTDDNSLNAQINALEMRNSIPFKGIVRREEKRITKLAENLRGLAELFKTVVTSSGKKIHDATSKISSR
jgi:hypothetical protein